MEVSQEVTEMLAAICRPSQGYWHCALHVCSHHVHATHVQYIHTYLHVHVHVHVAKTFTQKCTCANAPPDHFWEMAVCAKRYLVLVQAYVHTCT